MGHEIDRGTISSARQWVAYDTAEAAASEIGFSLSFPDEAYGHTPTDFLIVTDGSRRFLSIEYWDSPRRAGTLTHEDFVPIAIVRKGDAGMPPGTDTDTTYNRHHCDIRGNIVTVCGNGVATSARWKVEDEDTGKRWYYYATVGMPLTDMELCDFLNQFE